jgi:hypothetical protein
MTLLADGTRDAARAKRDWEGEPTQEELEEELTWLVRLKLEADPVVGPMRRDEVLSHEHDNREDEDR